MKERRPSALRGSTIHHTSEDRLGGEGDESLDWKQAWKGASRADVRNELDEERPLTRSSHPTPLTCTAGGAGRFAGRAGAKLVGAVQIPKDFVVAYALCLLSHRKLQKLL